MSASTSKSGKSGKKKGRPSRVPALSPISYIAKLKGFFESNDPDDYFRNLPLEKIYGIDKKRFVQNLKIKPKLPKEYQYIPSLEGCSQLQNQWLMCARSIGTLEIIIQLVNTLFGDTRGLLSNCTLITGCDWNYDYHPLDSIKMLLRQYIDLQKIFSHKYAYYRHQLNLRLQTAQILYEIPIRVRPVYLNLTVFTNSDKEGALVFRKQISTRYTQYELSDINLTAKQSPESTPGKRPYSPAVSDISMVEDDCGVPGEQEIQLPKTHGLEINIQVPETTESRKKKGKFRLYNTESITDSSDSDSNDSFCSAKGSPVNSSLKVHVSQTTNQRTITCHSSAMNRRTSTSTIHSEDEMSISEDDQLT